MNRLTVLFRGLISGSSSLYDALVGRHHRFHTHNWDSKVKRIIFWRVDARRNSASVPALYIYIYQTGVFVMLLNSQVIKVGLCAITSRHTIRGKLVSVQLLTGRIVFSLLVYRSQFILGNLSLTTIERFNSNWLHNVASKVLNFNGDILCSLYFIRVRGNYEIIV